MILGDPALAKLARLKLRGALRKQVRRLNRPTNVIFAVVGLALMAGWLLLLALRGSSGASSLAPDELRDAVCAGSLLLVVMTMTSSLAHRGLYLPPAEVELLLAAPVSRANLVRYRVASSAGRALFGGLVIGLMAGRHMPHPLFGFAGAFLGTLLLPVLGQGVSLLAGSAENRLAAHLARLPFRWINLVLLLGMVGLAVLATGDGALGERMSAIGLAGGFQDLLRHPLLVGAGAPFRPWALMMTAPTVAVFAQWTAVCAVVHWLLFELVARVPVDFRELSLATSADVARRLRRFRRGGTGSSSWEVSKRSAGRSVPWLFGRGPFGAVAWRKSAAILRKARGTLFTGAVIVSLLTVFSTVIDGITEELPSSVFGPLMIALIGTVYLCAGLRFDFREDLEQMEVIKSWPLSGARLFLATILPEVLVVTVFITAGIVLRGALSGDFHPAQIAIVAAVPLIVTLWASIDNAVFLYAPIRYTPGQEGALHHTGRALTLMLLRMLVFAGASLGVTAGILLAMLLQHLLDLSERAFGTLAFAFSLLALVVQIGGVIALGGRLLRRFDVARDRG